MTDLILIILVPFLPVVWAAIAGVYWWRSVSSPWLFVVCGMLALLGVQVVVAFLWKFGPILFASGGYFMEEVATPEVVVRAIEERNRNAMIQSVVVLLIAIPFLRWLRNGLASKET